MSLFKFKKLIFVLFIKSMTIHKEIQSKFRCVAENVKHCNVFCDGNRQQIATYDRLIISKEKQKDESIKGWKTPCRAEFLSKIIE